MSRAETPALGVAVGGLGAIGTEVASRLAAGIDGLRLAAVSARRTGRARERLDALGLDAPVLPLAELADAADVVVECAPAAVFAEVAEPAVRRGRVLVAVSAGALLTHWHLVETARCHGARILVPSGALLGLDAVRAAAEGTIHSVRMTTRKPPAALAGAPYLAEQGIDVADLREPLKVFSGSAREGAAGFPANVNVAAALGLAGLGVDATTLEIWADPGVERNCHRITVDAEAARFEMTIENAPSPENPRTGMIVAQSVVATLRGLASPLVVGA